MNSDFQKLYQDALDLLHRLTTPHGILASTIEADNYKRIWARDSVVCGLAGLWIEDPILTAGLKNSLLTLAMHQHSLGMIPSNVLPGDSGDVSFGSLAGRIDANTWFIVGSCAYYLKTQDGESWSLLRPAVEKCRTFLKSVEFNDKGWLYTPLSGNWADEYPIHGYTLYDNALRLWGESLWNQTSEEAIDDMEKIMAKTKANFWPSAASNIEEMRYHPTSCNKLDFGSIRHYIAFILPGKYDTRFDAAGNAVALLQWDLTAQQKKGLSAYISQLSSELKRALIPAFWPVIDKESDDWNLMEGNYSFSFKNHPGAFHNGGIWPVWMGLFCLGLAKNGLQQEAEKIIEDFMETVDDNPNWDFQEFFDAYSLLVGGKTQMGYTASGIVFMKLALTC